MIKRIIFDIDNTLLDTTKDCLDTYNIFIRENNLNITAQWLYDLLETYQGNYEVDDLSSFLNANLNMDFDVNSLNDLLELYSHHSTLLDEDIPSVLSYLSNKYELVCLSSWYYKIQEERLNNAGILKYFKKVYGFENAGIKPDSKAFLAACDNISLNECLVVGDSIKSDIEVPNKMGINTILFNTSQITTDYDNITSLNELVRRL